MVYLIRIMLHVSCRANSLKSLKVAGYLTGTWYAFPYANQMSKLCRSLDRSSGIWVLNAHCPEYVHVWQQLMCRCITLYAVVTFLRSGVFHIHLCTLLTSKRARMSTFWQVVRNCNRFTILQLFWSIRYSRRVAPEKCDPRQKKGRKNVASPCR